MFHTSCYNDKNVPAFWRMLHLLRTLLYTCWSISSLSVHEQLVLRYEEVYFLIFVEKCVLLSDCPTVKSLLFRDVFFKLCRIDSVLSPGSCSSGKL